MSCQRSPQQYMKEKNHFQDINISWVFMRPFKQLYF